MTETIANKPLPAVRLAERTAEAPQLGQASIGPAVGPLFDGLARALDVAGTAPIGPPIAWYESLDDGRVRIHAGFPVPPTVGSGDGWTIAELGPVEEAATTIHLGSMATIDDTWALLRDEITARPGLRPTGVPREVYLRSTPLEDQSAWITELQWPVERV